jgi:hypothetical protein
MSARRRTWLVGVGLMLALVTMCGCATLCVAGVVVADRLSPCKDEHAGQVASADGRFVARTLVRNCGATDAEYLVVELVDRRHAAWLPMRLRTHVLFSTRQGILDLHVSWTARRIVSLSYARCGDARYATNCGDWRGVAVQVTERDACDP